MQIRVFFMLCGLAVFAGGVAGAYLMVFRGDQDAIRVSGSGRVRQGKVDRSIGSGAAEVLGRATVEAGESGATVDFGRGMRLTLKRGAQIDVVSMGERVVSVEWKAGDVDVAHDGVAGVSLAVAVEIPGHDGARFLTTGGRLELRAGGKGAGPSVAVVSGDVLREHRGEIARGRKGESLAVRSARVAVEEMSAELVRTVGTGGRVASPEVEVAPSGGVPTLPPSGAAPESLTEKTAARVESALQARRTESVEAARERVAARSGRARTDARASARATASPSVRRAATPARTEPGARREERATASPDGPDDMRQTRIKRATTWR